MRPQLISRGHADNSRRHHIITSSTSLDDRITSTLIGRFAFNLAVFDDAASHRASRSESIGVVRYRSYHGIRSLGFAAAQRKALHARWSDS